VLSKGFCHFAGNNEGVWLGDQRGYMAVSARMIVHEEVEERAFDIEASVTEI
jgi:hypothetical protein